MCRPTGGLREAVTRHEVAAARVGRLLSLYLLFAFVESDYVKSIWFILL
jgi:hypothetical protein